MRNILFGGNKVISHLDEKRKRFPASIPFRRKNRPRDDSPTVSIISKSAIFEPKVFVAEPVLLDAPAPPAMNAQVPAPFLPAQQVADPNGAAYKAQPQSGTAELPIDLDAPIPQPEDSAILQLNEDIRTACTMAILTLFPEICPKFLQELSESSNYDYESIVSHILDKIEDGSNYPRRTVLKRKRQSGSAASVGAGSASDKSPVVDFLENGDADDADVDFEEKADRAVQEFGSQERREKVKSSEYTQLARTLLQQAFVFVPHKTIATFLSDNNECLLPAVLSLDNHIADAGPLGLRFVFKKTKTKQLTEYTLENLPDTIRNAKSPVKKEILQEYLTALKIRQLRKAKREAEKQRENEDKENFRLAKIDGTVKDCECCFSEFAMNRMVHCDGSLLHWYCKDCARRMAENQIGLYKYALACMSIDGCLAGFSQDQRCIFLDKKTTIALERIEQEHMLRAAGIENLETCPFCPFAAEYPPVEVNKEFTCQNPDCEAVSCRLCRKGTHIPKTCEEVERENGPSARLTIEEAMSAAMIRNCNQCNTPFIKEHGCNKMTCSRPGCYNVQCYVCHKSCDYTHFDDTTRGGKKGNCPLFENAEERHEEEVIAAEEKARKEVAKANPGLDINLLKIHVSEKVIADEKRRKNEEQERHGNNRRW